MLLQPIWHQVSAKTKQLIDDLKSLNMLLQYLISVDPVSFYSFLETFRESCLINQFKETWLLLDAANIVFAQAKERVFKSNIATKATIRGKTTVNIATTTIGGNKYSPNMEIPPKWKALLQILKEIELERSDKNAIFAGNILILAPDGKTASQIRQITFKPTPSINDLKAILIRQLETYLKWKDDLKKVSKNISSERCEEIFKRKKEMYGFPEDDLEGFEGGKQGNLLAYL
jgi:DNA excision repair protein ERCC-4